MTILMGDHKRWLQCDKKYDESNSNGPLSAAGHEALYKTSNSSFEEAWNSVKPAM